MNPRILQLQKPSRIIVESFEILKGLGEGAFGRVFLVRNRFDRKLSALKQLKKQQIIKSKQVDHLKNECYVLFSLDHPFIVKMKGFAQDQRFIFIAMEYVPGGELFRHLRREGTFNRPQATFYAAQVTMIWEYLHSQSVIYRDLKPENLLIDRQGYLKLIDFGYAKVVTTRTLTLCGTPEYMAPEVILNKGHSKAVDWWALGILLYEMLAGIDPFNDPDPIVMYQNIVNGKLKFPKTIDFDSKSLIKHLLQNDLTKRYGNLKNQALDVKAHRFFRGTNWQLMLKKEILAPYIPRLADEADTSNFNEISKSDDSIVSRIHPTNDPFLSW